MLRLIDLTGQKFGRWTVLYKAPSLNKHTMWHCQCSCGNEKDVQGTHLKSGASLSCGCLHKEYIHKTKTKNLLGQQFGMLTVIKEAGSESNFVTWICKCECGNITHPIRGNNLLSGMTKSCGCTHISHGEQKIIKILKENNISYEHQKSFDDCRFPNTNQKAFFDFYVSNSYLIEFHGEQHYKERALFYSTDGVERDKFKEEYCRKNNIPLIIIPYTHFNNLCIDDLLLETSTFIIREEINK